MTNEEIAQGLDLMRKELLEKSEISFSTQRPGHAEVYLSRAVACEAGAVALRALEWRPIDSAPKDGTAVLLGLSGWTSPFSGWWAKYETEDKKPGWTDGTRNEHKEYATFDPSHWLPLPAPPKEGA